jgi:uncharacterized glyoxalase superfamily protein PhnB
MTANRSAPPGSIVPRLYYDDISTAIEWLTDAFGFRELYRYGPSDAPIGAFLGVGDASVSLAQSRVVTETTGAKREFRPLRADEASPGGLMVRVVDVDAHCEHARSEGARILAEPTTHQFGERQYSAEDLAGHHWAFTESVADVAPEAWGVVVKPDAS